MKNTALWKRCGWPEGCSRDIRYDNHSGLCGTHRYLKLPGERKPQVDPDEQARIDAAIEARVGAGWSEPEDELDDDADLEGEACTLEDVDESPAVPPAEPKEEVMEVKVTHCKRTGCGKQLRKDNSKGVCSSGCNSYEAPPSHRAPGVIDVRVKRKPSPELLREEQQKTTMAEFAAAERDPEMPTPAQFAAAQKAITPVLASLSGETPQTEAQRTIRRFRQLCEALELDADDLLATFCEEFMEKARQGITSEAA